MSDKGSVLRLEDFRRVRERRRIARARQEPAPPSVQVPPSAQIDQLRRENRAMAVVAVTAYSLGLLCGIVISLIALNA